MIQEWRQKFCRNRFWIPLYKSEDFNNWLDYYNRSQVVNASTLENDGKSLQKCGVYKNDVSLTDYDCKLSTCFFCEWNKQPSFRLRGLCPLAKIESQYVISTDKEAHHNGLLGLYSRTYQFHIQYYCTVQKKIALISVPIIGSNDIVYVQRDVSIRYRTSNKTNIVFTNDYIIGRYSPNYLHYVA